METADTSIVRIRDVNLNDHVRFYTQGPIFTLFEIKDGIKTFVRISGANFVVRKENARDIGANSMQFVFLLTPKKRKK